MGQITLDMSTAQPLQTPPPVKLDMSTAQPLDSSAAAPPKTYKSGKDAFGSYATPSDAAEQVADMLGQSVKSLVKVSSPNVVYEMIRSHFPQLGLRPWQGIPTANEVGATGVSTLLPAAEGIAPEAAAEEPKTQAPAEPAPKAASSTASILQHPAVAPFVDALKEELYSKIPGYRFTKVLGESLRGLTEGTPDAPLAPPTPGVPETNGVPWGSGGQGPLDLRGKVIPQAPAAAAPETVAPQPSAPNIPARAQIYRDATRQNVPYAGADEDAADLQQITKATINKAIPPEGDTLGLNRRVQAQVDLHLSQGDVPAAESVLDDAAKASNPKYTAPDRPRITPSVQNIRDNISQVNDAQASPNRPTPDSLDDRALSQEFNWDLERHGWAAESEARREFIARNSTGVTKADLTGASEKPVKYTKTPGVPSPGSGADTTPAQVDDLMQKMQSMLDAAKKAKQPASN
jgi:hypothetical protein